MFRLMEEGNAGSDPVLASSPSDGVHFSEQEYLVLMTRFHPDENAGQLGFAPDRPDMDVRAGKCLQSMKPGELVFLAGLSGSWEEGRPALLARQIALLSEEQRPANYGEMTKLAKTVLGHMTDRPGNATWMHPYGSDLVDHQVGAARAKTEPDEAIVWVSPDRKQGMVVVVHRGPYLYAEFGGGLGDAEDAGFDMSKKPDAFGFYHFEGTPWSSGGDPRYEDCDWGIDGVYRLPISDADLARFGVTWADLDEAICEYREELEEKPAAPAM